MVTTSAKETQKIGAELAKRGARIVCLYGELGSGKTTFAQGFAKGLGITSRLLSPTFIIVRRYDIPLSKKYFYHVDLYRVKSMRDLGLEEIFTDPHAYTVIEWADKLGELLPKQRVDIRFVVKDGSQHEITTEFLM